MLRVYLRILGYLMTLILHITNGLYMTSFHQGEVMEDPEIRSFVGRQWRFITCWTFLLQMVYAVIGLTCDILTLTNKENKKYEVPERLTEFRDIFYSAIIWPSSIQVATLFWPFYLYDQTLVYPDFIDKILTRLSNHIIHSAIVPVVLWEMALQPREVPKNHTKYLSILSVYTLAYFTVLIYTYVEQGVWIYPIFGRVMGTIYLPILVLYIGLLIVFSYQLQWYLTSWLWSKPIRKIGVSKKKLR